MKIRWSLLVIGLLLGTAQAEDQTDGSESAGPKEENGNAATQETEQDGTNSTEEDGSDAEEDEEDTLKPLAEGKETISSHADVALPQDI